MGGSLVLYIAQFINYGDKARMGDYGIVYERAVPLMSPTHIP